jgi:transcriptional regulator with XRE-family HTH domain
MPKKKRITPEEEQFNGVVGSMIERVRRERKVTLLHLGRELGVSAKQVHFWEMGQNRVPMFQIYAIGRILRVPITSLMPMVKITTNQENRCAVLRKSC